MDSNIEWCRSFRDKCHDNKVLFDKRYVHLLAMLDRETINTYQSRVHFPSCSDGRHLNADDRAPPSFDFALVAYTVLQIVTLHDHVYYEIVDDCA